MWDAIPYSEFQPRSILSDKLSFNPFHAEATFIHGRKMQNLLKTIQTLSCWYSLESSR